MGQHEHRSTAPAHRSPYTDRVLLGVLLGALLMVLLGIAISAVRDVSIDQIVEDPSATTGAHPLTGALSNLGVLAWAAGAAVALFAAVVLFRVHRERRLARFLLSAGLLTAYLAIDDLYLIHDELLNVTPIPQPFFLALLVGAFAVCLFEFRQVIATTEWWLVLLAGVVFGASLAVDFGSDLGKYLDAWDTSSGLLFVEDTLKWLCIVAWVTYLVRTSAAGVVGTVTGPANRPAGEPRVPSTDAS